MASSSNNKAPITSGASDEMQHLQELAQRAGKTAAEAKGQLSAMGSSMATPLSATATEIPAWATRHLDAHRLFRDAMVQLNYSTAERLNLPDHIFKAFAESQAVVMAIGAAVDNKGIDTLVFPLQGRSAGLSPDLLAGRRVKPSSVEWQLNLGLLLNVYERTEDPEMAKTIQFLAIHYLAKAAPIDISQMKSGSAFDKAFDRMFQLGIFQELGYQRESGFLDEKIMPTIEAAIPNGDVIPFVSTTRFLIDTTDVSELLDVSYNEIGEKEVHFSPVLRDAWAKNIDVAFERHLQAHPGDPYDHEMDPPLLLDLTDLIGDDILCYGDRSKEQAFVGKMRAIRKYIDQAIDQVTEKVGGTDAEKQSLAVFLRYSLACATRVDVRGVGVIQRVEPFYHPIDYRLPQASPPMLDCKSGDHRVRALALRERKQGRVRLGLNAFVNYSGVRLGGVRGRERVFQFVDLPRLSRRPMISYGQRGANSISYPDATRMVESAMFQRFEARYLSPDLRATDPELAILGGAICRLVRGMVTEIGADGWERLNANADTRMIFQQSLHRLMIHMATADSHRRDFSAFTTAIELAHSEIATILAIGMPFQEGDFGMIYCGLVEDMVPGDLQHRVQAGATKSAMNTFAGVLASVKEGSGEVVSAYADDVYFELVCLAGKGKTREALLDSPQTFFNLFVGEFHHNINIQSDHDHYQVPALAEQVRELLDAKPESKHVTLAIDATIDFIQSPHAEELVSEFADEIRSGKLNIVFFRSGQKFDMFGMDNHYGSPFWMVNNGGDQWKAFSRLLESPSHKTDPVTMQWFSLAHKYAPRELEAYRNQIFQNARVVAEGVPADLRKGGKLADRVRISTFEADTLPTFIDIKILKDPSGNIYDAMKQRLAERYAQAGAKLHFRASFGFMHANWNAIPSFAADDGVMHVRINPGVNPKENAILLQFIQKDIPAIIQHFGQDMSSSSSSAHY